MPGSADLSFLPAVNATLNGLATVLLIWGRLLVKRGDITTHRRVMVGAFSVSTLFLVLYLLHKWSRNFENTTFHAEGIAKAAYLAMLASHVVLAAAVPFMAVTLIVLGVSDRRETHRRLARIAWPIWLYVSVTGVAIYWVLYHLNPIPT